MACLLALARRLAPHGLRAAKSTTLAAFTAAVRVVDGVHRGTAHRRADALPSVSPRFSDDHEPVFFVGNFAYRCPCRIDDATYFRGGKFQMRVARILRDYLAVIPRRARETRAVARFELDVVDEGAHGNFAERQAVAEGQRCGLRNDECAADRDPARQEHVAFLAVLVDRKSDESAPERVVFDTGNPCGNVLFVETEINVAVPLFVPASLMPHGDAAEAVAAAHAPPPFEERLRGRVTGEHRAIVEAHASALALGRRLVVFHRHTEKY